MMKVMGAGATNDKLEALEREHFDRFMSNDQTKVLVSMVPPTQPPELLITLMRAAFNNGSSFGIGFMGQLMVGQLIAGKSDPNGESS